MDVHEATVVGSCARKERYNAGAAHGIARSMRGKGKEVTAYRCPFCHAYHVGHPPSMEQLERIAAAIRRKHQEGVNEH